MPGGSQGSSGGGILAALGLFPSPLDPGLNEGLSPRAGLMVVPHYFQAVEQEGRWKMKDWGYNDERKLLGPSSGVSDPPQPMPLDPARLYPTLCAAWANILNDTKKKNKDAQTRVSWGKGYENNFFYIRQATILTIEIGASQDIGTDIRAALYQQLQKFLGPEDGPNKNLIKELLKELENGVQAPSSLTIDVNWVCDGTEILAGFVGLSSATGFLSTYSHRATVEISGTNFGNYLPAAYLVGLSGSVNPVGPVFLEFRCGVLVSAAGRAIGPIGLYGNWWRRDPPGNVASATPLPSFDASTGWHISLQAPTSYPSRF